MKNILMDDTDLSKLDPESILQILEKHIKGTPHLPCPVRDMSPREHEIFKQYIRTYGMVLYLAERLVNDRNKK